MIQATATPAAVRSRPTDKRVMTLNDAQVPTILLPLDLTNAGETKITVAIEYARMLGARVVLLHVLPRRALDPAEVLPAEAAARTYLDTVAAELEAAGVAAASVVRRGSPGPAIVAEAAILGARLIVLSSNVRPLMANVMHASVGDHVARHTDCPVLLVRPRASSAMSDGPRSFAEDAARAGTLTRRRLGVRSIEVARIVGSLDRAQELGPDFRRRGQQKLTSLEEQRFQRILALTASDACLPPISVYKLGFGYYIEDGHHRVAAARLNGQTEIDADVTEFLPASDDRASTLSSARRNFEQTTGLTDITAARPETYAALLEAITAYRDEAGQPEFTLAARRWERKVFRPLWHAVRQRELAAAYPGDLSADVVARLWVSLRGQDCRAES